MEKIITENELFELNFKKVRSYYFEHISGVTVDLWRHGIYSNGIHLGWNMTKGNIIKSIKIAELQNSFDKTGGESLR